MERTKFAEMLEAERKRLGHSQKQTAEFLFMSQSAYSRMEAGETNPGVKRSREMIKRLEKHGYMGIQPIELEEIDQVQAIKIRWPWGKPSLYVLIALLILVAINYMADAPADLAEGFSDGVNNEPVKDPLTGLIFLGLAIVGAAYGIYRLIKRWRR